MSIDTKRQEVELKVHLWEPLESLKQRFRQLLRIDPFVVDKRDIYYQSQNFSFRLRCSGEEVFLTFKETVRQQGIEVNREWETQVDSFSVLQAFCERLKISPLYEKSKKGWGFSWDDVTVELLQVQGLSGVFVEIEVLLEHTDQDLLVKAKNRLWQTLALLDIPPSAVEPRPYAELLGF